MSICVEKFNVQVNELFTQLCMLTDSTEIKRTRKKIMLAIKFDELKAINEFCNNILPHKHQIDTFDETYFLNPRNYMKVDSDDILSIFSEFKDIWVNLSDENKKNIFQYFQILCILAEDYKH